MLHKTKKGSENMSKFDNTIIGSNLPPVNGNIKFHLLELLKEKNINKCRIFKNILHYIRL